MQEKETLYLKVRKEVKEKLERIAMEEGVPLVDVASEALEKGLGFPVIATDRATRPTLAERLIGTWKLKNCRNLTEEGYCRAWELQKEEAERIYGKLAKELFELRTIEKPGLFLYVEKVEVYSLKPTPHTCMYCPFFERG